MVPVSMVGDKEGISTFVVAETEKDKFHQKSNTWLSILYTVKLKGW